MEYIIVMIVIANYRFVYVADFRVSDVTFINTSSRSQPLPHHLSRLHR